jgi:hypothetical protein
MCADVKVMTFDCGSQIGIMVADRHNEHTVRIELEHALPPRSAASQYCLAAAVWQPSRTDLEREHVRRFGRSALVTTRLSVPAMQVRCTP